jgi:methylmalonyl-CoA/ethylmalonyl-CoA epimerase
MPNVKKINHVALVVEDIDDALTFWQDALGIELTHQEDVPKEESAIGFLPVGDSKIELVQPTTSDSGVAKFLAARGPGMHHICLQVDDIDAMLVQLQEKNIRLIHEQAITGDDGRRYAFIHPKAAHGVLVELYELDE